MEQDRKGLVVHLYYDEPTGSPDKDKPLTYLHVTKDDLPPLLPGQTHVAETLLCYTCKQLNIGAAGFYLFGLQALRGDPRKDLAQSVNPPLWIPPNKPLECIDEKLQHFQLRIRFIPSITGIRTLARESNESTKPTLDYFFLQCRSDFVNDRIKISENYKLEHILGLGVIDKLRWGKEHGIDPQTLKKSKPWPFLPSSSNKHFKMIWDKKRLTHNFSSKLDDLSKDDKKELVDHKMRYIIGILTYSMQYGVEEFDSDGKTIIVDPKHEEFHGFYTRQKGEDQAETGVCHIEDVMSLSLNESQYVTADGGYPWIVTISRKHEGHPQTLSFPCQEKALSFMSLIDGYHRLTEDFHEQVSSNVFSPLLKELDRLKCFGPISVRWAEKKLKEKHEQEANINYILYQDATSLESYIVSFLPAKKNERTHEEVRSIRIKRDEDGMWHCDINIGEKKSPPKYKHLRQLLEYYRSEKDGFIKLKRYVTPTGQCDRSVYVCCLLTSNQEEKDMAAKTQVKSQVNLVSRLNGKKGKLVGKGKFTEVFHFLYEKEGHKPPKHVALKHLQPGFKEYLEEFTRAMNDLSFWKCPTIVSVDSICLYPFQVVMDYGQYGDLRTYISTSKEIQPQHLNSAAEQVAQALLYLQEYGERIEGDYICHGNIRCSNVFVFDHGDNASKGLTVKLGDSGMVEVYKQMPLRDKVNEERMPWMAPELIDDNLQKGHSFQFADVYSFGVFLWELYSEGERPFKGKDLREIISTVFYGAGLGDPLDAPEKIKNLTRRCLHKNGDKRPTAKEIVRVIRHTQSDVFYSRNSTAIGHQYSLLEESEADKEVLDSDVTEVSTLSDNERVARVDELLNTPSLASFQHSPQLMSTDIRSIQRSFASGSTITETNSVPQSPTNVSGPWNSTTPLIHQRSISTTNSVGSHDLSVDTSRASQDTTTTELDEIPPSPQGHVMAHRPLPAPPSRPIPSRPTPSRIAESIDLEPDRVICKFEKENILGKGHYGEVYQGEYLQFDGSRRKVAIKSLKSSMVDKQKEFVDEINTMTKLSHPFVVQIIGQTKKDDSRLLLVMEFVDKGCLRDHLSKIRISTAANPSRMKELHQMAPTLIRYSREMAEAMIYLSNNKIIHRDLAARNVLVTHDDHMKISDFGLARNLTEKDYYAMTDRKKDIPVFWCAPESLKDRRFTTKTDVWSLGITLWETFSFGKTPNLGIKVNYLLYYLGPEENRRLGSTLLYGCPPDMYSAVMHKCWQYKPEARPTFIEILDEIQVIEERYHRDNVVLNS